MQRAAIYPGTFDPLTNGHMDIVCRSLHIFDKVIISVAPSYKKQPLFTVEERVELIQKATENMPGVSVEVLKGLLADYFREKQEVVAVVRGLRAVSDFEYELQMALMNQRLNMAIETVFMMPSEENTFLTSTSVKEVAFFGGDIREFVPKIIADALYEKLRISSVKY
ncbi:MAG TPA: pantetheine-phosphate adenylyltransferase [Thermodesulfovibrionia bacterium]|nr:pantetheine-phosphate adenylyltransferase [Thermodesulfovibrionia bacterium]